jgi:hypothetical protein
MKVQASAAALVIAEGLLDQTAAKAGSGGLDDERPARLLPQQRQMTFPAAIVGKISAQIHATSRRGQSAVFRRIGR